MADCGPNCDCANCCITPLTYNNTNFVKKINAPEIVLATAAAFPTPGASGTYADDIMPAKPYLPQDKYTSEELDTVLKAVQDNVVPLFTDPVVKAEFPELAEKINTTPFTRVEMANFIDDFNLLPVTAVSTCWYCTLRILTSTFWYYGNCRELKELGSQFTRLCKGTY
jgi:hypothetical protein